MKILVVDDIGYSRHNLAMVLQRLGHEVVQAGGGSEALSILGRDLGVELVITDLIMDDVDGVELFNRAKQLERIGDQGQVALLPFILLTCAKPGRPGLTSSVNNRFEEARHVGFAEILFKPINPKVIEEALNGLQSAETAPAADVDDLIGHLKDVTQKFIRSDNPQDVEKLKHSLQEQLRLLEGIVEPAEA
jgi:CheY-like chemotaxis protein